MSDAFLSFNDISQMGITRLLDNNIAPTEAIKVFYDRIETAATPQARAEAIDDMATYNARWVERSEPAAFKRLEELLGCRL